MKRNFLTGRDGRNFLDRENDARLVIGPEQGDDGRFGGDRGLKLIGIKKTIVIYRQPGDLIATGGEVFAEFYRGAVLD